jgi:hypothetical protein
LKEILHSAGIQINPIKKKKLEKQAQNQDQSFRLLWATKPEVTAANNAAIRNSIVVGGNSGIVDVGVGF